MVAETKKEEVYLRRSLAPAEAWKDRSIFATRRGFMNPRVIRSLMKFILKSI